MPYRHKKAVEAVAFSPLRAAAATGLRPERISRAIAQGELHAHRVGVRTLITREELSRWIASHPPAFRNRRHQTTEGEAHVPA